MTLTKEQIKAREVYLWHAMVHLCLPALVTHQEQQSISELCDQAGRAPDLEAELAQYRIDLGEAEKLAGKWFAELIAAREQIKTLREALERITWFDWSDNDSDAVAAVQNGRNALAATAPKNSHD